MELMDSPYDMEPPSLEWQPEPPLLCEDSEPGAATENGDVHPSVEVSLVAKWRPLLGQRCAILVVQITKFRSGGLGISLEGTVDVEQDGAEVRPHHYVKEIAAEGPVGRDGRLQPGDELLEANAQPLFGVNHRQVVAILKGLPRSVRLVCARHPGPEERDSPPPFAPAPLALNLHAVARSKSEDSLLMAPSPDELPWKGWRSLEPLNGLAVWSRDVQKVELDKGERGLGFSIMEYRGPLSADEAIIIVRSLVPGGVAHLDGRLFPGDRLLFVNDTHLERARIDDAVLALQAAWGRVRLGIVRPLRLVEGESQLEAEQEHQLLKAASDLVESVLSWAVNVCLPPLSSSFPPPSSSSPSSSPTQACRASSSDRLSSISSITSEEEPPDLSRAEMSGSELPEKEPLVTSGFEDGQSMETARMDSESEFEPQPVSGIEQTIHVKKYEEPLGIEVENSRIGLHGFLVRHLVPGGAAYRDGRLSVGDCVTGVNLESLRRCSPVEAVAVLRRASLAREGEEIRLTFIPGTGDVSPSSDTAASSLTSSPTFNSKNIITNPFPSDSPVKSKRCVYATANTNGGASRKKRAVHSEKRMQKSRGADLGAERKTSLSLDAAPDLVRWGPERVVHVQRRKGENLNLSIIGGRFSGQHCSSTGVFVREVAVTSPAHNLLHRGDRILEVNGVDLREAKHDFAVETIRCATNPIRFRVQSLGDPEEKPCALGLEPQPPQDGLSPPRSRSPSSENTAAPLMKQQLSHDDLAKGAKSNDRFLSGPSPGVSSFPHELPNSTTSPVAKESSAVSQETTPVAKETAPVAKNATPVAEETAPVAKNATPVAEDTTAIGADATPVSESTEPPREPTPAANHEMLTTTTKAVVIETLPVAKVPPPIAKKPVANAKEVITASKDAPDLLNDSKDTLPPTANDTPKVAKEIASVTRETVVVDVETVPKEQQDVVKPILKPIVTKQVDDDDDLDDDDEDDDDDEEDEFGYTSKALLRKYGDLDGKLYLLDVLRQTGAGLGLSLSGNADPNFMSVFICGIRAGSAVDRDGRLAVGDELLEVNGHVLQGRSHLNAAPIIGQCQTNVVKFVLHRADTNLAKMAVRTCAPSFAKPKPSVPEDVMELSRITPNGRPVTGRKLSRPLEPAELPNGQVPTQSKRSSKFKEIHPVYGDVYIISIEKGDQGLGFAIMEGSFSDEPGIYVKHVTPDSRAAEEGTLQMGDRLLSINGKDVAEESYDVVLDCLRSCAGMVTMLIGRRPDGSRRSSAALPPSPAPSPLPQKEPESAPAPPEESQPPRKASLPAPSVPTPEPTKKSSPVAVRAKKDDKELMTCPVVPAEETEIVIEKNRAGLGISIVGGRDTLLGIIIIHEVYPDGAAARDGRLWAGDQVLEVNNVDLRSVEHELAIQTLRQSGNRVRMLVFRDEKPLEEKDLYDILTLDFMKKASKGLGISIVGRKNDAGVYVSEVVKGGVAETDGRIRSGDQILEVNGADMRAATQEHVATVLKSTVGKVALTIGRLKARVASPRPDRNLPRSSTGEKLSPQ